MNKFQQTKEVVRRSLTYISGKTLDAGAGRAKYREIIKQKASEYHALDMSPREHIDIVGSVLDMPVEDGSYDTVVATEVLEHVKKPWVMVQEIKRVLKKDGVCVLTAPFLVPEHPDPSDCFRYTVEGMKSLFEEFEILECDSYGKLNFVLSEFIRFSWFNPYASTSGRTMRLIKKMAGFLDRFTKNKAIYAGVYIVARKK